MLEHELEARLNTLQEELGKQPSLVSGVMRQVRQSPAPRRRTTRRWLMRSSLGLSAAAVAAACWLAIAPRTTPAYGIEDLPSVLLKVKSIHVKGKVFHVRRDGKGVVDATTEYFVERPCRSWGQGAGFSNDDPPRISYSARDGKHAKFVDPTGRIFRIEDDDPLLAELAVEGTVQNVLIAKLYSDGPEQFHKVGEEKLNGHLTDRYERVQLESEGRREGWKYVVWLEPISGLPIRLATYRFEGLRPEDMSMSALQDIEVNVPARAEMFDFDPPEGYRVNDLRGQKTLSAVHESGGNGDERMGIGPALNIDDRALLVCWAAYDGSQTPPLETELEGPPGRIIEPGKFMVLSGPRKYHLVFLRADPGEEHHWRWSLLVPVESRRRIGDDTPTLRINAKQGGSMNLSFGGLRFPRERLESLVVEIQRLTLPPDAPDDTALTLVQIEAFIDRVQQRDRPNK